MRDYAERIEKKDALQAHPEYLNEQINDHDKAIYAKGWNDCNKEYYNAITELPVASIDCTDLSARLRRTFEADELVNQRILLDAADAIEELLAEKSKLENSGKLLVAAFDRLKEKVPHWISVEERLPKRTNPLNARDTYLVRLESGCIKTLFYEYDNSDRCRPGMSPLFSEGWGKTAVPVTHWMPLPEPPKEGTE